MAKKLIKSPVEPESFAQWISKPANNKKKCVTCRSGEDILEYIRAFMRHRIEGRTRKRNYELYDWLKEHKNYKYLQCTLNRHMRECERTLYIQMRKADIRNKLVKGPAKLDKDLGRPGENYHG